MDQPNHKSYRLITHGSRGRTNKIWPPMSVVPPAQEDELVIVQEIDFDTPGFATTGVQLFTPPAGSNMGLDGLQRVTVLEPFDGVYPTLYLAWQDADWRNNFYLAVQGGLNIIDSQVGHGWTGHNMSTYGTEYIDGTTPVIAALGTSQAPVVDPGCTQGKLVVTIVCFAPTTVPGP